MKILSTAELILKPGREKSLLRRHPWIFSGAVDSINGEPHLGETVDVFSSNGIFLAKAGINQNSNIIARVWTFDPDENVDRSLLSKRLNKSISYRKKIFDLYKTNAMRLVNGESDGLPGLILDKYADSYVVQFLTAGAEFWKNAIIEIIVDTIKPALLYERSDMDVRKLEGLEFLKGVLYGKLDKDITIIDENGILSQVDIVNGHKTGYYLDQRENHILLREMSRGMNILDCFSYTGGFTLNALYGGAECISVIDSSNQALKYAQENIILNNYRLDKVKFIEQDVFTHLRILRDKGAAFDLIVLDPPKFAPTSSHVDRAARGYKDINLLALKLLNPGGILMTFSCSGGISEELFQKIVAGAALDAGIEAVILNRLHQAGDHPVALNFPEGAYLKGFVLQKR